MKFRILSIVFAVVLIISCSVSAPVYEVFAQDTSVDENKVLFARIENMLDHNQVYGDDFDSTTKMVNNSLSILLDKTEDDSSFIDREIVEGFVYNMYGITLAQYEENPDFPKEDGFIFIVPRGFDLYDHTVISVEEDGDYLYVESEVCVTSHDGQFYELNCLSNLKKSEDSSFGYIIVYSLLK